ncbi:MAG TPA: nucleotidyl transferase AbiEii/AbiGii toxin family protein [Tepidisphaeraceae bacterium]
MEAANEVEQFCRAQRWRFCFIGGVAVQRWGMPRFTQDVDLTLMTGLGSEGQFVEALLERFPGRLNDTRQFALETRVVLLRTAGGVDLDFSLGAFPFEEGTVERASLWTVDEGISITTCSAEDLLIHKAFASRDRDWGDVESILSRRHGRLDLAHVRRELPALLELKDDFESMGKLERMIASVDRRLRQDP